MPVLQPAENWEKTGRYEIDELFKLEDRKGSPLVLAMTHEEAVTYHVAREVRSYRDLPLMLFHLQTKERDEPRPRAGVLRTREFTMKDAYSFDRDEEGLERSYELQAGAYDRIFDRCGLRWYRVESDVGMMGGSGAHEYMAPCPAGENEVALAPGYAANVEVASAEPQPVELPAPLPRAGAGRDARADHGRGGLRLARGARRRADQGDADRRRGPRPGARPAARRPPAQRDQAAQRDGDRLPPGQAPRRSRPSSARSATSARSAPGCRSSRTRRSPATPTSAGPTSPNAHLRGVDPARDFEAYEMDVRTVEAGDTAPGGGTIEIEPAIEVGNIFKLGTRYSEPLGATYLDEEGKRAADRDGQLRDRAGADRRGGDRAAGRRARDRLAARRSRPGSVHLVSLAKAGEEEREAADRLYAELRELLGRRGPLRRPRRRPRGEAHRRRAARLPAADRRRPPRPRRGRRRGDRARRRRRAQAARGGGRRAGAASSSRASMARRSPAAPLRPGPRAAPLRARPQRPAAAPDPEGRAAQPLDDPQLRRLRAARRDPALPLPRLRIGRRPLGRRRRSSSG